MFSQFIEKLKIHVLLLHFSDFSFKRKHVLFLVFFFSSSRSDTKWSSSSEQRNISWSQAIANQPYRKHGCCSKVRVAPCGIFVKSISILQRM